MTNGWKILLAEDNFQDYNFLKEGLKRINETYSIEHAKDGMECMQILKNNFKPDLIFLDLNMPGYTGIDCLKFIKNKEILSDVPVIIYSTSHYIRDIDACFVNEAHYYLVKPDTDDRLYSLLRKVIDRLEKSNERPCKNNFVMRMVADLAS